MKIMDSTLSMDAYVRHMEVQKGTQRTGFGGGRGDRTEEQFLLRLVQDDVKNTGKTDGVKEGGPLPALDSSVTMGTDSSEPLLAAITGHYFNSNARVYGVTRASPAIRSPFSLHFDSSVFRERIDQFTYSSTGSVTTADGRSITFSLDLSLTSRETVISTARRSLPLFYDPLVLNFDDSLTSLADSRFHFDLDVDGEVDRISSLGSGSGYLALDRNGDRVINDGGELFGPLGAGFDALREYDMDGNNWIDENDPVFEQLLVWMGAGGAEQRLISLREAGVGALSLTNVDSLFNLKDSQANVIGQVARSGLFVMEDGRVKSLQEIELALDAEQAPREEQEPIFTIRQAILVLELLLARRQRQLSLLLGRASSGDRREESLTDKFWRWQEESG